MERWTEDLTTDMIPEPYRHLAEIIGVPALLELAKVHGGAQVYVPKYDTVIRQARDERIKREFNGYNADEVARRYDISPRWVYIICQDEPIPGQVSLFDQQ